MKKLLLVVLLGALAWQLHVKFQSKVQQAPISAEIAAPPATITALVAQAAPTFTCDGRRYCSQMTSCEEATYFLVHCPDTRMDGDHDGIPCETQWCR